MAVEFYIVVWGWCGVVC